MFLVFERCQDGWFKGTSMHTSKIGVFPGNYVAPVTRYIFIQVPENLLRFQVQNCLVCV